MRQLIHFRFNSWGTFSKGENLLFLSLFSRSFELQHSLIIQYIDRSMLFQKSAFRDNIIK